VASDHSLLQVTTGRLQRDFDGGGFQLLATSTDAASPPRVRAASPAAIGIDASSAWLP
jgi:hypothetical protein